MIFSINKKRQEKQKITDKLIQATYQPQTKKKKRKMKDRMTKLKCERPRKEMIFGDFLMNFWWKNIHCLSIFDEIAILFEFMN